MKKAYIILFILVAVSLIHCGGGDGPNSDQSATWTATVDGEIGQFSIKTQTGTTQADGGVILSMTGKFNGTDITFSIDISGGLQINIDPENEEQSSQTIQVASSSVNVSLDVGTVRYRGTSGKITFTAYDANENGTVTGTLDTIGLVGISLNPAQTATLQGAFSIMVSAPVTEEE